MQTLLTRDECRLVQASFAEIEPIAHDVAAMFYGRLFELNPGLRPLFKSDMKQQGVQLMEKLAVAVHGLEAPESIAPLVGALGRRHGGYGVTPADYDTACEALLWSFSEAMGAAFSSELRAAWRAAFQTLSVEMIRVAEP
jgi:hemoglobin-like flavoprotein